MNRAAQQIERLISIMKRLRAESGCPWDKQQNFASLRPYLIEEAYEVLEQLDEIAIGGPSNEFRDELGDLLFQIVFHCQIASERNLFELADVIQAIADKIEFRHPHVFANSSAKDASEVAAQWSELKAQERLKKTGQIGSVLDGVPKEAPALLRAERLSEKASRVGFDWKKVEDVRAKLDEELAELDQAISSHSPENIEHELGDVLFTLANLGRWLHCPTENALRSALRRFIDRFHFMEKAIQKQGRQANQMTLEELDELWNQAKAAYLSTTSVDKLW